MDAEFRHTSAVWGHYNESEPEDGPKNYLLSPLPGKKSMLCLYIVYE